VALALFFACLLNNPPCEVLKEKLESSEGSRTDQQGLKEAAPAVQSGGVTDTSLNGCELGGDNILRGSVVIYKSIRLSAEV
jgi:hypothetical protein